MRKSPRVIETRLPGELILLDPSAGEMYSLNEAGAFIWDRLDAGSPDGIAAEIAEAFEVPRARAEADVEALIEELARVGLTEAPGAGRADSHVSRDWNDRRRRPVSGASFGGAQANGGHTSTEGRP